MKKVNGKRNRNRWLLIVIISLVCTLFTMTGQTFFHWNSEKIIVYVNGYPITHSELHINRLKNRTNIRNYFKSTYGIEVQGHMWEEEYHGEVPEEKLITTALNHCIEHKILQIEAKKQGLVEDISFQAFVKRFKEENKRREKAFKNNQVIYGPKQYKQNDYYDIVMRDTMEALKDVLRKDIRISREELNKYYKENKEIYFKETGSMTIEKIEIQYGENEKLTRSQAEDLVVNLYKDFPLSLQWNVYEKNKNNIKHSNQVLNKKSSRTDSRETPILFKIARKLSENERSTVFEENGAFYFLKCTNKEPDYYLPLKEVEKTIENLIYEEDFEAYMDECTKMAELEFIDKCYSKLFVLGLQE